MHGAVLVAVTFQSLYITAAIALDAPLASVINLVALVAAYGLWFFPPRTLRIAAGGTLVAMGAIQLWAGLELLTFCLAAIVGVLALSRWSSAWLDLGNGAVLVTAGWSGITMGLNENLVPVLFTDALPGLDLHLPPLVASLVMTAAGLGMLTIGAWKAALRIEILAFALLLAAAGHLAAGVLGFLARVLPSLLAEVFPSIYSLDEDSLAMYSTMISTAQMGMKSLVMGALIPLALVIAAIVRFSRQPSLELRGAPLLAWSPAVAVLTAFALAVPGILLVVLAVVDQDNPLQIILPLVIDGLALVMWVVAVFAWWRHTAPVREGYAPGGDMDTRDVVVTLVLAPAPGLLALLDLALAFVP